MAAGIGQLDYRDADACGSLKDLLSPYLARTPLVRCEYLSKALGANIHLKMENLQKGGSIKGRGGYARILLNGFPAAYVTASSGNHGISLSMAAKELKAGATIFVPDTAPAFKIQKIKDHGAAVCVAGDSWDHSNEIAQAYAKRNGHVYVHPFEDPMVAQGYATAAEEILEDLDKPDVFLCSIGGGGIISGMGRHLRTHSAHTKIYGVETYGAHSM